MNQNQRLAELIVRFGKKEHLSEAELHELSDSLQQHSEAELSEMFEDLMRHSPTRNSALDKELVFKKIIADRRFHVKASPIRRLSGSNNRRSYIQWAAMLAIFMGLSLLLYTYRSFLRSDDQVQTTVNIRPAKATASLLLGDGRHITLREAQSEVIIRNRQIFYGDGMPVSAEVFDAENQIKLHTPYGGTYKITFADGTQVQLNAGSTISFPVAFPADSRRVELVGEAYFDVEKGTAQRWPFEVHSEQQIARVLGTTFNISAYPNTEKQTTTLYTGSLEIVDKRHAIPLRLKPSEQVELVATKPHAVVTPVGSNASDWTRGLFVFDGQKLSDIMAQVERWYNVEVVFQDPVQAEIFNGSISRYKDLADVLAVMEMTGTVKFQTAGRRVTVIREN